MGAVSDPIEALNLSSRGQRLLRQVGCRTVADLLARWPDAIARAHGVGQGLMRELYDRLRKFLPDDLSKPATKKPRGRAIVPVPYTRQKQAFLANAEAAWARAANWKAKRTTGRRRALEKDRINFLRMLMQGMSGCQMAQKRQCTPAAIYARKRRLILSYVAHRTVLHQLPVDIQAFVLTEAKKYLAMRSIEAESGGRSSTVMADHGYSRPPFR